MIDKKFKAWNKEARRWSKTFRLGSTILNYTDDDGLGVMKSLTNEIVVQYIGLEDKFGVSIYEDYIVKSGMTGATYLIYFDEETSSYMKKCLNTDGKSRPVNQDNSSIRVIGNKYENPELLK